jgi:5-formyltetrahydrofolate cyclo-ligase
MPPRFHDKEAARRFVWDRLAEAGAARFPFPPHGRIPNFAGAREAAERLFETAPWSRARRLKINPDAPQLPVRELALRRGIVVYVPTPRLRGGFRRLDPRKIPPAKFREAASLSRGRRFAEPVELRDMPELDAIVVGSVAVTRRGRRAGKGHGYGDLEYAILRELGHRAVPVATTVHPLQIVGELPTERNDLPVSLVVTPDETIRVRKPPRAPREIDWRALSAEDLEAMPILGELRRLLRRRGKRRS